MNRETITEARKIQLLRLIRTALSRGERPTMQTVGLSEPEFTAMADEELFEFAYTTSNPKWEDCHIVRLHDRALVLLASAGPAAAPRANKALGRRCWELVKIVLVVLIGWQLLKHFLGK